MLFECCSFKFKVIFSNNLNHCQSHWGKKNPHTKTPKMLLLEFAKNPRGCTSNLKTEAIMAYLEQQLLHRYHKWLIYFGSPLGEKQGW